MNWHLLEYGFWHPFGPYTGLSVAEILKWKRDETSRHGWTLWSFAYSRSASRWLSELAGCSGAVFALCSVSPAARDPDPYRGARLASHYRFLAEDAWHPMPDPRLMKVTNPFRRSGRALAFKVARVIELQPQVPPILVEWFSRSESRWRSEPLPTRGEFLLRSGGAVALRRVCAVLELAPPYLAEVKYEPLLGAG